MTWQFDPNNNVTSNDGAAFLFGLKEHLVNNAGWSVPRSNNGTTAGVGDNIDNVADLTNLHSWMVLRRPDDGAEWLFYMGGSAGTRAWDILYSAAALFTGGTTTTAPTATDQDYVFDDSTNIFISGNSTISYAADDAAPYGWVAFGWDTGGANTAGFIIYDPIVQGYADDPDPYICGSGIAFSRYRLSDENDVAAANSAKGWTGPSATGTWGAIPASEYRSAANTAVPSNCGVNPYSGGSERPTLPILYVRNVTQGGTSAWKGFGTVARWVATPQAAKDTLSEGTDTYIVWGALLTICVPWPNGVVPAA